MSRRGIFLGLILSVCVLQGCGGLMQSIRPYRPANSREELLWAKARRDVFPEDVRRRLEPYRNELLAWPGIISLATQEPGHQGRGWKLIIAHHYWDWTEQSGRPAERVLLSPRGEGFFQCVQPALDSAKPHDPREELAIVYGYPEKVLENDIIQMHCVDIRSFHRSAYATDVLEYGRNYVLKQDPADVKVLRNR